MQLPIPVPSNQIRPMVFLRRHLDRPVSRNVTLGVQVLILLASVVLSVNAPTDIDGTYLSLCLWMALSVIALQFVYRATGPKPVNWLSIDIVALLPMIIIHFTIPYYLIFDILPYEERLIFASAQGGNTKGVVCFATMMSVSALAAFAIGFNLLPDRFALMKPSARTDTNYWKRWRVMGIRTIIVAAISGVILLAILGPEALEGRYSGSDTGHQGLNYLLMGSNMMFLAGLALVSTSTFVLYRSIFRLGPIFIVVAIYIAAFLIHGDRDMPFTSAAVVGLAYAEHKKRLSFRFFVLAIIMGSLTYSIFGIARNSPERTAKSMVREIMNSKDQLTWDRTLNMLGTQVRILYAAVNYIPKEHDFFYGKMKAPAVIGAIPWGNRILFTHLWLRYEGVHEKDSATFLTWVFIEHAGDFGAGTTNVADIYIDFGYTGVIFCLFCFGALTKFVQQKARSSGTMVWNSAYCFMLPMAATSARATIISGTLRSVGWPTFIVLFLGIMFSINRSSASTRRVANMRPGNVLPLSGSAPAAR